MAAPESLAQALRETVWQLDRNLPVSGVVSLEQIVAGAAGDEG